MNVSARQLRAFVTLADCHSFAEASETLHLSQPALSMAIRKLEDTVGGSLFSRSTRHLELSPEGRGFLPTARRLLADWDKAFDDLGRAFSLQQGSVRVAVMPSFAMNQFPEALLAFRRQHPGINITVQDIVMESVLEAVRLGQADLGITFEPEQLDGVTFTPLFSDCFVAVVAGDSPLAKRPGLSWEELVAEPFIAMNRGSWSRATTDAAMARAQVTPGSLLEANQLATIGRMVAVGLGVSVVPSLCQGQMETLGVRCLPLSNAPIERQVGIFTRRRHPLSQAAQALAEAVQAHFSSTG